MRIALAGGCYDCVYFHIAKLSKIPSAFIHLIIYSSNNAFACKNKFQIKCICRKKVRKGRALHCFEKSKHGMT